MILSDKNKVRKFENTEYFGYLFYISYDGKKFESFDENPNMKSVKSYFRELLNENKINFYKGIQQAGRTDKGVSALSNILYINSKQNIELNSFKNCGNENFKILAIEKTMPFLEFPSLIESRHYIYKYPLEKILNNRDKIIEKCKLISGNKNFKKYTTKKGEKLQNHIRSINIIYNEEGELHFIGDSFLPQQVRIMSGYLLTNKLEPLAGEYLTLHCVKKSEELNKMIFKENNLIKIYKVEKIDQNEDYLIFYVKKQNKSEIIGKNGKNIKKIRKEYGNVIIKVI